LTSNYTIETGRGNGGRISALRYCT